MSQYYFAVMQNKLSNEKNKRKTAIKLLYQFSHHSSDKLITLLKDDNVDGRQLFNMVENINTIFKVCQR